MQTKEAVLHTPNPGTEEGDLDRYRQTRFDIGNGEGRSRFASAAANAESGAKLEVAIKSYDSGVEGTVNSDKVARDEGEGVSAWLERVEARAQMKLLELQHSFG